MFPVGQSLRFAEWLQLEISKRGWSQSDCARACNLNRAVINKLLNGRCNPQPATLMAIARGLKIPVITAYQAAGLLPASTENEQTTQELLFVFSRIKSPRRKATAIRLLNALANEEESEQRTVDGRRHGEHPAHPAVGTDE